MLGLSLLYRYQNKRGGTRLDPLYAMLDVVQIQEAEILGRAMRLGAMLWLDVEKSPGKIKWKPKKKELVLQLAHEARPLFGEVAEARLASLTEALGATTKVRFEKPAKVQSLP